MTLVRSLIITALAFSAYASATAGTTVPSSSPAWNLDFPDPSIVKAKDGYYYAFATQTIAETTINNKQAPQLLNIQVARTKDLKTWSHLGDALPEKPTWAHGTQKFWAPHVSEHAGKFYMYFSAERDGVEGLCLGVAVATQPNGPFTDIGHPLQCGPGFENIDPMSFDDPIGGKTFLYWGSGFGPIKVQELANDRISFAKGSSPTPLVFPQPKAPVDDYIRLVEGAWVEYKDGTYFLFFSGDNCCEGHPHYAVLLARSKSPLGPFELAGEAAQIPSTILVESKTYTGPGHNSIVTDDEGKTWILYHAIDVDHSQLRYPIPGDRTVRRILMKDRLCWPKGSAQWPNVSADGSCP